MIDTTGNAAVFALALEAAANYGKVILLGDTGYPEKQHLTSAMMSKGLTVRAVHDSHDIDDWTEQRVNKRFFELVANGRMSLEGLISHRFSPLQHEEAYETADRNRSKTMGVLFDWGDVEF